MCIFFSCIVTRDGRVLFTETDEHEEAIKRANLKDDKLVNRDFVRIEVPEGILEDYTEDEKGTLPSWYSKERVLNTLKVILPSIISARKEYDKVKQFVEGEWNKAMQAKEADYTKLKQLSLSEGNGTLRLTLKNIARQLYFQQWDEYDALEQAAQKKYINVLSRIKGYVGEVK